MMLCVGKDPEMWDPYGPSARLAMLICQVCPGCPDNDPEPHGVIRHGVPYTDSGKVMMICPNCDTPNPDYRGGGFGLCRTCAVPDIAIPSCRGDRNQQIATLAGRGMDDRQIGFDLGLQPESVRKRRQAMGVLRKATPQPVREAVAT